VPVRRVVSKKRGRDGAHLCLQAPVGAQHSLAQSQRQVGKSDITRVALETSNETCKKRRKRDPGKEQQEETRKSAEGEMYMKENGQITAPLIRWMCPYEVQFSVKRQELKPRSQRAIGYFRPCFRRTRERTRA
jgi:hypothetical protein